MCRAGVERPVINRLPRVCLAGRMGARNRICGTHSVGSVGTHSVGKVRSMSDPVRRDGVELGRLRLPVTVTSPKAARDLIGIMVAQWGLGEEVDFVARLAVCELVTNALHHCAGMPGSTVLVVVSRVGHQFRV